MIRVLLMGREAPAWSRRLAELAEPAELELETARLPAEGIRRFEATPPDAVVILDEQGGARSRTLLQALQTRPLGRLVPLLLISPAPGSHDEPEAVAAELGIYAWRPVETSARELLVLLARVLEVPADDLFTPGPTPPAHPGQREEGGFLIEPLEDAGGEDGDGDEDEDEDEEGRADLERAEPRRREEEERQPPPPAPPPRGRRREQVTPARREPTPRQQERRPEPRAEPEAASSSDSLEYVPPPGPVERRDRASFFPVRAREVRQGEVSEEILLRKLKEVRHEDYFTILEIRRGAEGAVIRQAYQRMIGRYDPDRLDFELVHRHYQALSEIRDALEDAWAVLGDPELRRRYMAHSAGR